MLFKIFFILHFFLYALIAAEPAPAEEVGCSSLRVAFSRLFRNCCCCCTDEAVKPITIVITPPSSPLTTLSGISIQKQESPVVVDINSLFVPEELEEPEKIRISLDEMRMLIVENNETSFRILKRFCQKIGIKNIEWAKNGKIGVQKFKDYKLHLVFIDRHMPVMNGIDATREIRTLQLDWGIEPIIICVSDDDSQESQEEFKKAGANGFFHKPFRGGKGRFSKLLELYFEFVS